MSYTTDQQIRIDTANTKVALAQKARDLALADYKKRYDNFCNDGWWSYLTDCDIRDGVSKWKQKKAYVVSALIASTGAVFVWGTPAGTNKWTPPSSCGQALEMGPLVSYKCKRGKSRGDCIDPDTCEDKVAEYNSKLSSVDSYSSQVAIADEALVNAQADLKLLLNTIAGEISTDPAFQLEQSNIMAGIQKNKQKLIFFGILIAVVIIGIIVYKRLSPQS